MSVVNHFPANISRGTVPGERLWRCLKCSAKARRATRVGGHRTILETAVPAVAKSIPVATKRPRGAVLLLLLSCNNNSQHDRQLTDRVIILIDYSVLLSATFLGFQPVVSTAFLAVILHALLGPFPFIPLFFFLFRSANSNLTFLVLYTLVTGSVM